MNVFTPDKLILASKGNSVFLAGSIENGTAELIF